jgi:hypothetical protein
MLPVAFCRPLTKARLDGVCFTSLVSQLPADVHRLFLVMRCGVKKAAWSNGCTGSSAVTKAAKKPGDDVSTLKRSHAFKTHTPIFHTDQTAARSYLSPATCKGLSDPETL